MRIVLLGAVLVGLSASGGYLRGATRAPAVVPTPAACDKGAGAARGVPEVDLRRAVRDAVAASRSGESNARPADPVPAEPAASDPAPLDEAMLRMHQAIAQRQWTTEDAAALGRTLEVAAPEQREAILHALIPALNRGEVHLTYRGELF